MTQEVKDSLKVLKAFSLKDEAPEAIKDIFTPKYLFTIESDHEYSLAYNFLRLYFLTKAIKNGDTHVIPQAMLRSLVVFFINGQCDKEARELVGKTFMVEPSIVASEVHKLKSKGILVADPLRKKGVIDLSEEMKELKTFYEKVKESGKLTIQVQVLDGKTQANNNR